MFLVHCFTKIFNKKAQGGTKEMKRKWIALVLSVSVLAGIAAVPAICFGDTAGNLGDAGSGNTSGSYACRDGFRG